MHRFSGNGRVDGRTHAPATRVVALCAANAALLLSPDIARALALEDCAAAFDRQDYAEALRLCRPLAEQGEDVAQTTLGSMYEHGRGGLAQDEAVKWYRRAAEKGVAYAQIRLGLMYEDGRGGVAQADAEALISAATAPRPTERPASASATCSCPTGQPTPAGRPRIGGASR